MPYILSKLANTQNYTQYAKGVGNLNVPVQTVTVNGGADITGKNLITPEGVITKISADELEILKANKDFQRHLEQGHVKYFGVQPNIEKASGKMTKDVSRPLTPSDYSKKGKKVKTGTRG